MVRNERREGRGEAAPKRGSELDLEAVFGTESVSVGSS